MSAAKTRNIAASVRQRLLNLAHGSNEPFDLVLVRYALERLLYRLSVSEFSDRFVLKGALLFTLWGHADHRPTRDADLLGFGPDEPAHLQAVFRQLSAMAFEDGITYDPETVAAEAIAEDKVYAGIRVTLQAGLDGARIPVQFDIGFGDVVTPAAERAEFTTLLDFPPPVLRIYPVYTVIAEKFHSMVVLGAENSRMKDFYDLWAIAGRFELEGAILRRALAATFERRATPVPVETPFALTPGFASDKAKLAQWSGFIRKSRLRTGKLSLSEMQNSISALVMPAVFSLNEGKAFDVLWQPGGPWKK
ncbi:MAG: nucleotidyl transferase AbiEii/AbiGii toxin family protein [Betaproteobacteria bacterium]|nr:nucleotidyl transferase AbiEii/AbiGii toxin family protein [Betaproteobacteria bacterium]